MFMKQKNAHPLTLTRTQQKNGSFSLIERVILSAGAMLIFSVSFLQHISRCLLRVEWATHQIDQMFRRTLKISL